MRIHKAVVLICTFLACLAARAELRTWTDSDGTKLEAELVESINGQVALRNKEGKEGTVSISSLSADHQV